MTIKHTYSQDQKMINSPKVYQTNEFGFSQAIGVNKFIFLSGQVGWNQQYTLNGPNSFENQTAKTFSNVNEILKSQQGSMSDIVLMRFYVKGLNAEKRIIIQQYLKKYFSTTYKPATTLIGIETLAREELLIEIEAIAIEN